MKSLFTSESVTEGHPDKLCDYISDSILDEYLKQDKEARVACETVASKGEKIVTGEITSKAKNIDIEKIVRNVIKEIGYDNENLDMIKHDTYTSKKLNEIPANRFVRDEGIEVEEKSYFFGRKNFWLVVGGFFIIILVFIKAIVDGSSNHKKDDINIP